MLFVILASPKLEETNTHHQGCQNQDFTSDRKGVAKPQIVKSQSISNEFTQGFL